MSRSNRFRKLGASLSADGTIISSGIASSVDLGGIDSGGVTNLVDSDYVQLRQVDIFKDSAFVTGLIDSAYVSARASSGSSGGPGYVEGLFVGGGGASSGQHTGTAAVGAGGAGGGGIVYAKFQTKSGTLYSITIGSGGAARTGTNTTGNVGGDTTFALNGGSTYFTAKGGGGGGFYDPGSSGGSGGSHGYGGGSTAAASNQTDDAYRGAPSGSYIDNASITVDSSGQLGSAGYNASPGTGTGTPGGGGATEVGKIWGDNAVYGSNSNQNGGDGGDGYTWFMNSTTYGGGGGGTAKYNATSRGGSGGAGGGGRGGDVGYSDVTPEREGQDGFANTGGGGGGGVGNGPGGDGGSGVVILYCENAAVSTTGTPVDSDVSVSYNGVAYTKKYTFTGSGTIQV